MIEKVLGAVVIVVAIGYWLSRFGRFTAAQWFLVRSWRWLSGEAHHGRPITDAGWFRGGERALTTTGHATRWWHLPRWKRAGIRSGSTLTLAGLVAGWMAAPAVTLIFVASTAFAGLSAFTWVLTRRILSLKRQRTWLHPLHLAAHELAGIPRAQRAASWIKAELDEGGAVRKAVLELPPGWPADVKDKQRLVAIAAAKLGIEAPEPEWRSAGPKPLLTLTHSESLPELVEYDEVAAAVERAGPHELVSGLGKKGSVVKASLATDSPHAAINMGTGAGKSSLVAFWLMQELRRGSIAMVLDSKWFSHPWLYKDEEGEYSQLPNVAYLSSPEQLHAGMVWLGKELDRRNQVARRAVTASGELRGNVGPRLIILAEELNFAMPQLRQYWADTREPSDVKKSPALTGFGGVAFAGRAVKMHLFLIGQMLTAEVTGSKDSSVKENVGITAMARYGPPGWNTAVGKNVPMPPSPSVLGRVQLVTASGVRETQAPRPDLLLYRELAMSGTVTPCPAGMPGAVGVSKAAQLAHGGSDMPVVSETVPVLGDPASRVTLSEAVDQKIVRRSLHAVRKASQRDPDFPEALGQRGLANEYDPVQLAEYEAGRR